MQNLPLSPAIESPGEPTADSVMLLILTLARRRAGAEPATVAGWTLGLVGFDNVAEAVARRAAHGFGMRVLVYSAHSEERAAARQFGAEISPSLGQLLAASDVVSLHGLPSEGGASIDAHRLNQMKLDGILINATHGGLMNEQDLLHALWFETIGGAGIAVDPDTMDRLKDLEACDNTLVLPEAGGARCRSAGHPVRIEPAGNVVPLFPGSNLQS